MIAVYDSHTPSFYDVVKKEIQKRLKGINPGSRLEKTSDKKDIRMDEIYKKYMYDRIHGVHRSWAVGSEAACKNLPPVVELARAIKNNLFNFDKPSTSNILTQVRQCHLMLTFS